MFENIVGIICNDALNASHQPVDIGLQERHRRRPGGGEMIEFVGDNRVTWAPFMPPAKQGLQRLGIEK
jgi:hypothetical protein